MVSLFKNKSFTLLFLGRLITNAGDSLYYVAAMWLVYKLGGSSFYTGLAGFLTLFPNLLQFLTGPLVDRWPLKKTLLIPEITQGIIILIIPLLAFLDLLSVTAILIIMPILSLINQFVYPAQAVALPQLLKKEQLVKGNSAMAFAYQGIDMFFNAIAGIIIALIGAVSLLIVDSITFAIAAILFASLKLPKRENDKNTEEKLSLKENIKVYTSDLKEGFTFIMKSIFAKFFVVSVVANFTFGAAMAVLPAYADWRGGPEVYGALLAALSAGLLIGALLAPLFDRFPLGKLVIISFIISAFFWFSSVSVYWNPASIILLGLATIPIGATNVILAAVRQIIAPQHLLARISSVGASISMSAMPVGSLIGGFVATIVSSTIVFYSASFGLLFISVYFLFNSTLRKLPNSDNLDAEKLGFTA